MPRASSTRPSNQDAPRLSNISSAPSSGPELPEYQSLQHPLNTAAKDRLAALSSRYQFRTIQHNLDAAADQISTAVGDINDRLAEQDAKHQKHKKRRTTTAEDDDELDENLRALDDEEDEQMEWTRTQINNMTNRLAIGMRRAIDSRDNVTVLDRVLRELQNNVAANSNGSNTNATQTTTTATQRSARVTQPGSTMDSEAETQEAPISLVTTLETKLERARDLYEAKSMRDRYSQHNKYVNFQRILHDATHSQKPPGQAPALEDPRYWFREEEGGSPPPGNTRAAGEDEDDDIAIARHNISTRCPITLLPYVDPVTSIKCPHSFERENIMTMIRRAPSQAQGRRGAVNRIRQEVECPVPGCSSKLGEEDLKEDPVLVRQIKRIQKQNELRQQQGYDDDEDEHGRRRVVEEIMDDDDDDQDGDGADDIDRMETQRSARIFKRERTTQSRTQEEDIEDDDDDD